MTAPRLYRAGFTDLVSVVPPNAEISSTSSLSPETRGKVPGKCRLDGTWVGYPFTREDPPTEADIAQWESWGANIGLRAGHFPGLDVDAEDEQLVRFILQEAERVLGPAPVRTSRNPRRLLVYATREPFTRIAATVGYKGQDHVVEMLGAGRQYLVHGQHPSGTEYGWEGRPLWDYSPGDLSFVTAPEVHRFFTHIREKLEGRATVEIEGTGETKDTLAPAQEELEAPDLRALSEVVKRIPNDYPDRDTYIQVGHAIKAAGGEEAFNIFAAWADRWEQGTNEAETVAADWSRMHPPFRVGWPYLQDLATERSDYTPALDAFEADPEAQPREVDPGGIHFEGLMDHTDTWVMEQVARRIKDRVRYVPETGHWHIWGED